MSNRSHRFVPYGSVLALAMAVMVMPLPDQHARPTIMGSMPQHGVTASVGVSAVASARRGAATIVRVSFNPDEFHYFR